MSKVLQGERRLPGGEGVWFFIAADMVLFLLLFYSFSDERLSSLSTFRASQAVLSVPIATLNTIFLLTSSWLVALGVWSFRNGQRTRARSYVGLAFILGMMFVVAKAIEYYIEASAGASLTTNSFFMFYFVITGLHLLHVMGGAGVLVYLFFRLGSPMAADEDLLFLEAGASIWHMVDVLWLIIFPLIYLLH